MTAARRDQYRDFAQALTVVATVIREGLAWR
jgi:hypothetical protein